MYPRPPGGSAVPVIRQSSASTELLKPGVCSKSPELMLVAVRGSGYKQARVSDAAIYGDIRRSAAHDGDTIPLRSVVLLLSLGRNR